MMDDIDRSFDWWNFALQGTRGPIEADHPRAGFYRSKSKDGSLKAVAVWFDSFSGDLRAQENGNDIPDLTARERWPYWSKSPISEEVFWQFRDTGSWPDVDAAAQEKSEDTYGDAEKLAVKINKASAGIPDYTKIESDEQSAKAQSLRDLLTKLKGEAVKQHKDEKEPHLEQGRLVDQKWFPLRDLAASLAEKIKTAQIDWEDSKRHAQMIAETQGVKVNMPAPSAQIKGATGRAASVSVYESVVIDDEAAVYRHFKGDADLTALLLKLAQKSVDAGLVVPGTHTEQKTRIR